MKNNNLVGFPDCKAALIHALVFLLPFSVLILRPGVSLCSFVFVLSGIVLWKQARLPWARHLSEIRWVLIAFGLNFLCALASGLLRPDEPLHSLEKPLRMLLAAAALLSVLATRPSRRCWWWGVIGGAFGAAGFVLYQRFGLGLPRPGGFINPITYGDLALCLGLLSLVAALEFRGSRWGWWPWLAALAGLLASGLTGTRGSWVALVVVALASLKYGRLLRGKALFALAGATLGLLALLYLAPQSGMRARVAEGISDVRGYVAGGSANTSLGLRFEMWKAVAGLVADAPLLGHGIESYRAKLHGGIAEGRFSAVIADMEHAHNDALQQLVTGGLVGFAIWLATLAAPLRFFGRVLAAPANRAQTALALGGALIVLCYASFGLTEVIFWSMRGTLFYALAIFILMGLCLNAKDDHGN